MGYGVYEGDGAGNKLVVSGNTFQYDRNGSKNAMAIWAAQVASAVVTGNTIRASATGRLRAGIRLHSVVANSERVVSSNTLSNGQDGFDSQGIQIHDFPGTVDSNQADYLIEGNHVRGFTSAVRFDVPGTGRVCIQNNILREQWGGSVRLLGTASKPLLFARIHGNTITRGKRSGIDLAGYCVSPAITSNTIVDGNLLETSGDLGAAVVFRDYSSGSLIAGNAIGNTPGAGQFTCGIVNLQAVDQRIFKDVTLNNSFFGFNTDATPNTSFKRFPVTVPLQGIFDVAKGDFVQNTEPLAGAIPGWHCVHAKRLALTADASGGQNTLQVTNPAGVLVNDLILLVKNANPYVNSYFDPANWHATTVTNVAGNVLTVAAAIPAAETYTAASAEIRTVRFKAAAAIAS